MNSQTVQHPRESYEKIRPRRASNASKHIFSEAAIPKTDAKKASTMQENT